MQVQKSLNTALLVAILFTQLAKEPQIAVMKPFEVRTAAAANFEAAGEMNTGFKRHSRDSLKDPVSFYDNRQTQLLMALTK